MVIDVQGAELNVLQGIDDSDFKLIESIQVECSTYDMYKGQSRWEDVDALLTDKGFVLHSVFVIDPNRSRNWNYPTQEVVTCNKLADLMETFSYTNG